MRELFHIALPAIVAHAVSAGIFNNGHPILYADQVAEPADRKCAAPEISEFPRAVQTVGISVNVVVDMVPVGVSANDKGMSALQKTLGKFIADAVSLLRCDLTRSEGLPHLIGDHIAVLPAPGQQKILPLGKCKISARRLRVTGIGADQFAIFRLVRIFAIVQSLGQALLDGFALVQVQGNNAGGCYGALPPLQWHKKSPESLPLWHCSERKKSTSP